MCHCHHSLRSRKGPRLSGAVESPKQGPSPCGGSAHGSLLSLELSSPLVSLSQPFFNGESLMGLIEGGLRLPARTNRTYMPKTTNRLHNHHVSGRSSKNSGAMGQQARIAALSRDALRSTLSRRVEETAKICRSEATLGNGDHHHHHRRCGVLMRNVAKIGQFGRKEPSTMGSTSSFRTARV